MWIKILLLVALLFALFAVVFMIPQILRGKPEPSLGTPADISTESMEGSSFPTETSETEPVTQTEAETEPETETEPEDETGEAWRPKYDIGEPVERTKYPVNIFFASDIHYMSQRLTDYGNAFDEMIDNGDGKVVRYMPQIWQAFAEEVVEAGPSALVLSGDLTINGEKENHQELAGLLDQIEAAGIPVLVIPGNHDINNPYATSYFGEEQSFIEGTAPEEFKEIYGQFGYDEAASHAPDSLSYLYILNDTTWMLMLDTCIYEPENLVGGMITDSTLEWMEDCLKSAYDQGITVIPVGHHNLQELSRVYLDECVIENHEDVANLLEWYLTPMYFSGHLHVQRIQKHITEPGVASNVYGIWEVVSNSLIIPPCQYGRLSCMEDGSMSYHTKNTDVSGWAAKYGETNPDLLDFPAFSDSYIRDVISRQTYKNIEDIPDYIGEELADFYADLYQDYYAGRQIDSKMKKQESGYKLWDRFMNPSIQFRQVEGMLKDGMVGNNNAEIPNPVRLERTGRNRQE